MRSESSASVGSGRRCAEHGLALAPDGSCVLCRSASRPPRNPARSALSGLLLVLLFGSAGALAHRAVTGLSQPRLGPALAPVAASALQRPLGVSMPAAPQPMPAVAADGDVTAAPPPAPPPSVSREQPVLPAPAQPLGTALVEVAKPPAPSPAALRAALAATPVVMYGTSWCGVCKRARQFMAQNGLHYREIDADQTPGGWESVAQLTGRRAVPVIVVDGEVTGGLDERRVMDSVARSIERRLGVSGIHFTSG